MSVGQQPRLWRWIPNAGVLGSNPVDDSEVDQVVTRNSQGLVVKSEFSSRSGSTALGQLNLKHKKGPYFFSRFLVVFFFDTDIKESGDVETLTYLKMKTNNPKTAGSNVNGQGNKLSRCRAQLAIYHLVSSNMSVTLKYIPSRQLNKHQNKV